MINNKSRETKYDFKEVLNRMIEAVDGKTQSDLAEALGIRGASISSAKKRGAIPFDWDTQLCLDYNINPQWIRTGIGPKKASSAPTGSPLDSQPDGDFKISDMVSATVRVLESDTVYRTALASNIRAFDEAVQQETDVKELKEQMSLMLEKMNKMEELLNKCNKDSQKRDKQAYS